MKKDKTIKCLSIVETQIQSNSSQPRKDSDGLKTQLSMFSKCDEEKTHQKELEESALKPGKTVLDQLHPLHCPYTKTTGFLQHFTKDDINQHAKDDPI